MAHPRLTLPLAALLLLAAPAFGRQPPQAVPTDALLPDTSKMIPFADDVPMVFVTRNSPEWAKLTTYFTEAAEDAINPATGVKATRKVVKVRVPLGLTTAPPVPSENPMT